LLSIAAAPAHAAEWPYVLWPAAPLDDPRPAIPAGSESKNPSTTSSILRGSILASIDDAPTASIGGARSYSVSAAQKPTAFEKRLLSPFHFEGGARYWYSSGTTRFGFTNGNPQFGNPTSTLDWSGTIGNSGEAFARVDHLPSQLFVKGLLGGGRINGGHMDDRDFLARQIKFSDTTSDINGDSMRYAMFDVGYSVALPSEGIRIGAFVGYHYWRERMTAFGSRCNPDDVQNVFCGPAGSVEVPFTTPGVTYETVWKAARIGGEAKIRLYDRWTVDSEIAIVPYARLSNDDSHLLRGDLGPVPNVLTRANAFGAEAEIFFNYAVLRNFEVGLGARYWGMFTKSGSIVFGPAFSREVALTRFDTQRYGVLLQAKGTY